MTGGLGERFRSLPRAMKWVVGATIALVAFLAWDESSRAAAEFSDRADAAAVLIERYETQLERLRSGGGELERSVVRHGEKLGPGDADDRRTEFNALVGRIIRERDIPDGWSQSYTLSPVRSDDLERLFGGRNIERLVLTFTFEADAEQLTGALLDLESSPMVVGVDRITVRVVDRDRGRLNVRLDAATWVFTGGRGS